jgi:hypothetical protein
VGGPGESLSEWNSIQVPAGTTDRLTIVPAPLGNSPHALRAEVRDGDVAVNPYNGQRIADGWRAEGVGPVIESQSSQTVRQSLSDGTASVTGWFYANAGAGTQLRADLVQGGTVLATTTVAAGSGFIWRSISGPGVAALSQTALNDLRLRFTTIGGGDSNVRAAYATTVVTTCPS